MLVAPSSIVANIASRIVRPFERLIDGPNVATFQFTFNQDCLNTIVENILGPQESKLFFKLTEKLSGALGGGPPKTEASD